MCIAASGLLIVAAHGATAKPPEAIRTRSVGPGPVTAVLDAGQSTLRISISPNRSGAWNTLVLTVSRSGQPTRRAAVTVKFTMLSMSMGTSTFRLSEQRPGRYVYVGPATVMPGEWRLSFHIKPTAGAPQTASLEDRVSSQ